MSLDRAHQMLEKTPPLDLAHLARQTFGDAALEREALGLFRRYAAGQMDRLKAARTDAERRETAHALLGSALAVGADAVAHLAREVEGASGPATGKIAELAAALDEAQAFIARRLGG